MTDIEIVRGEIQPWTDRSPAGGTALLALLDDALPASSARTLIAGPHSPEVIAFALGRTESLTVLVRSVSDAVALGGSFPSARVIAGALDGFTADPFDVVLAADGLDRVLGADSPALDWPERASLLLALAAPDALVLVGVENEFALTALYDQRPVDARHGDDEWRPLHDDPNRPTSPAQVTAALPVTRLYASFASAGATHTLLDADAAAATRPGRPAALFARRGLEAAARHTPLIAPVADGADAAARAGLSAAVAPGWLAVCGPDLVAHTAYTPSLVADLNGDEWVTSAGARIPDTASVETELFRLAAAEDVPRFRAYAARLAGQTTAFDELFPSGDGFVPASPSELSLAAAWFRFRDRLVAQHRRHPWPPWMVEGDDLVTTWLGMSGVEVTPALLKQGRLEAGEPVRLADPRTALAEAEADRLKAKELAGRVFGLERTLRFRDQSLKTREQQIRKMRDELRRFRSSPAMKLHVVARKAAKIRHPRQFARAVKRRLRGG